MVAVLAGLAPPGGGEGVMHVLKVLYYSIVLLPQDIFFLSFNQKHFIFSTLTVDGLTSGFYQTSVPETAHVRSVVCWIGATDRDIGINAKMSYSIIGGDGRDTFDIYTDHTGNFGIIIVKRVRIHFIGFLTQSL